MSKDKVRMRDRVAVGLERSEGSKKKRPAARVECVKCGSKWTMKLDDGKYACQVKTCRHIFTPGN